MSFEMFKQFIGELYSFFILEVYPRAGEILSEPLKNEKSIWIVAPLLIVLFIMQVYFGRHRDEELGWNTAFGNSISLVFVCANLLRYMHDHHTWQGLFDVLEVQYKTILIAVVFIQALSLLYLDFFHTWPKKLAFFFSSAVFVNTTAFLAIVMVYSTIPFDWVTLAASGLVYVLVIITSFILGHLVAPSAQAEEYLKRVEKRKKEDKQLAKAARRARFEHVKDRWVARLYRFNLSVRRWWKSLFG
jgi:hypothetical protein